MFLPRVRQARGTEPATCQRMMIVTVWTMAFLVALIGHGLRIEKGQTVWVKVRMFVPDLNVFALNPTVRAVAQDFGRLAPE
jgi:hypothetical protein